MIAAMMAAPEAIAVSGLPAAVTIALSATALVAVGMLVVVLRRTKRLSARAVGVGAISAVAILVGSLFVGGSLTQPPAAAADKNAQPRASAQAPIEAKLTGLQLPTLAFDE